MSFQALRDNSREFTESEVIDALYKSQVFADLNINDLRSLLQNIRIMNFKPMNEVVTEGKFSAALYIVTGGRFLVLRPDVKDLHPATNEDDLLEMDTFTEGQCFGEYSLIDRQPASASVVAAEASQAIQIPRPAFDALMMSDYRIAKTVYHNLLLLLTARLRKGLKV